MKLKPCPFCGGNPRQLPTTKTVSCDNDSCCATGFVSPERWNRRASLDHAAPQDDDPYVIGTDMVPMPTLSDALICIAEHIEQDATEEAQQEGAVIRQAAAALAAERKRLEEGKE